jgi:hypothetical protein
MDCEPARVYARAGEGLVLATMMACVALAYDRLPCFPIHFSKTINEMPSRQLFVVNTFFATWLMFDLLVARQAYFALAGCALVPFIGVVSDAAHIIAHTIVATIAFACFSVQFWIWRVSGTVALGALLGLNAAIFVFVAWQHVPTLMMLCPPILWRFVKGAIEYCKTENWQLVARYRGALQWLAILVMFGILYENL